MISFSEAIAQCAEHIAEHDAHGYSQPNRKGHDVEHLTFSDGTPYDIHWGDYDCSEMARMCAEAAGLVSPDAWMWTGNEYDILTSAGFDVVPLDSMQRGDILWKPGHTGICLGDGMMADAHGDEYGGIDGPTEGDQTGAEIEIRPVWSCSWQTCFRPPMGHFGVSECTEEYITDISRGIDVSNHDAGVGISDIDCGFVIAKVSEGTYFVDKYCKGFLTQAHDSGKLYGMYHYANTNDPFAEAEFFVSRARDTGFLDGATLWLDYEGEALDNGPEWAERFMQCVDDLTGKTCGIYMSQSTTISQDWSRSAHRPLWVAQYADMEKTDWQDTPWTTGVFGAWGNGCAIHQYSCCGVVHGSHEFDIDKGYFSHEDWAAWATGTTYEIPDDEDGDGDYFPMNKTNVTFAENVFIRTDPSISAQKVAGNDGQPILYHPGETVTIDGIALGDGYIWGHYIGSNSGADRYVALGTTDYIR